MVRYCYIIIHIFPLSSHRSLEKPYHWGMLPWQPVLSLFRLKIWRKVKYWQPFKRKSKLSIPYQIHNYKEHCHSEICISSWLKTQSNILPFIFSLELSICVSPFPCCAIFLMFHIFNPYYNFIRLSSQWFLLGSKWSILVVLSFFLF